MGYLCDYCGEQRSIVYCRSDAASLCLSCDRNVHSANALSRRHSRTLSCERCNSQPAFVRCVEESISLCQNCDWMQHVGSNLSPGHKRQAVHCYSGCPSASELSQIWSFLLDSTSVGDTNCEFGTGSVSTNNRQGEGECHQGKSNNQDASGVEGSDLHSVDEGMESLTPLLDSKLQNTEHPVGSSSSAIPKVLFKEAKGPTVREDGALYDDFNMDEVDLCIENYEELFGVGLDDQHGIDGLFGTKDMSGSNCHGDDAAEGSSVGGAKVMLPACSTAASADSIMSCKTEPNLSFKRQTHSSISFSGLTEGEVNAGDYQDCGASSIPTSGEPPWFPPGPESSVPSSSRTEAVMRYMEKKKTRKFEKKVRYESRKARADVRRRVKGRFVKAGDAYDYDPLSQTRSF